MNKIYWCEGGLKLSDIATKNISENDLNSIIKYIRVTEYRIVYRNIFLYD